MGYHTLFSVLLIRGRSMYPTCKRWSFQMIRFWIMFTLSIQEKKAREKVIFKSLSWKVLAQCECLLQSHSVQILQKSGRLSLFCLFPMTILQGELQISNHTNRKSKGLTRKVVKVFRSSHSYKQRSSLNFWGSSAIFEDTPWEPSEDVHNSINPIDARAEKEYVPNLELAAIMVREICKNHKEADLGGWGLKFLKKLGKDASLETTVPSECTRNNGECSTSIDILIPAGLHGGPKTRVGGSSSLNERWISGGRCDCGGWDIGCPLSILNTRSSSTDSSECKSVDLYMQGSKQDVPILKMVNIHEGLYYIHFGSTLSTLQSFAIAAAIIHSHSPVLRSKVYRS